jgi:hypothetical protein
VWHGYVPTGSYARTISIAIRQSVSNYISEKENEQ